jgi:hypothetical protein
MSQIQLNQNRAPNQSNLQSSDYAQRLSAEVVDIVDVVTGIRVVSIRRQ